MKRRVIIVIPAYNEAETIGEVIERSLPFGDVCVVDDASMDQTADIAKSFPKAVCISHRTNTHIPRAIMDGMRYALNQSYDYVITMDAGLSHLPEDIPRFLEAGPFDLVLGRRRTTTNVPLSRKLMSRTATCLINVSLRPIGSGLPYPRFHDITSGFRRYSRKAVELLVRSKVESRSFDFHPEALMLVYRNGFSITEIPVSYAFSNSSLNWKVLVDSVRLFLDMMMTRRK